MNSVLKNLASEALKLDSGERMELVQLLLVSLHEDAEVDDAWTIEVERRIADIESGVERPIPMAEALPGYWRDRRSPS